MNNLELFWDSLLAAFFVPFKGEYYLEFIFNAGDHDKIQLFAVGFMANILGFLLTYFVWRGITSLIIDRTEPTEENISRYKNLCKFFNLWLFPVLLLTAFFPPIGTFIPAISGMLRTNLLVFIPLVAISKLFAYVWYIILPAMG